MCGAGWRAGMAECFRKRLSDEGQRRESFCERHSCFLRGSVWVLVGGGLAERVRHVLPSWRCRQIVRQIDLWGIDMCFVVGGNGGNAGAAAIQVRAGRGLVHTLVKCNGSPDACSMCSVLPL